MPQRKDDRRSFIDRIGQYDVLSHEEMIVRFKQLESPVEDYNSRIAQEMARQELIMTNLRLVISIAKQYRCQTASMPLEDIVQEGTFGLMKAIERFNWRRGYKFSTYATWWIKQSIGQFLLKRKRTVRLPAHAVTVQRYMVGAAEEFKRKFGHDPTQDELIDIVSIEKHMRVSRTVVNAMSHSSRGIVSLQGPSYTNHSTGAAAAESRTLEQTIHDESPTADPFDNVATHELLQITKHVMESLSPKEVAILRLRFGLCEDPSDSDEYPVTVDELEAVMSGRGMR